MSGNNYTFTRKVEGLLNVLKTEVYLNTIKWGEGLSYKAVWDTGATNTVISHTVVRKLELFGKEVDTISVRGVNSVSQESVYIIEHLLFHPSCFINNVSVICSDIGDECDVLIGMDIIAHGDFAILNYNNKSQFSFSLPPYKNKHAFVKNAEDQYKIKK